jgi:hypothetical protein
MSSQRRIIEIHTEAPAKPAFGAPCNGCGVCCLAEPCPLGVLLSRRLTGACVAVRWQGDRYVCGALEDRPNGPWGWLLRRWISSGSGCDCDLEPAGKP